MPANNLINEYIAQYDGDTKKRLAQLHTIIADVMPEAEQKISWKMPTYKLGKHNAFHFAASKNHISIFPSSYATEHFADKLTSYKTSKGGTIQLQNNEPLPVELVREIAVWRKQFMKENPEKG